MAKARLDDVLRFLRKTHPADEACDRTDRELLMRFVSIGEEAAFTILLERHGHMVLGGCRRILGDLYLAEDSFQATFIVLARRAASLRLTGSLGTWLYAVAQRIALRAKAQTTGQRNRERRYGNMARAERPDEPTWREVCGILDEEIGRLPEKYRAPLVLCYLESKSRNRVARELGLPEGTVARRLTRGRELLRLQLLKRGVTLSAGVLGTILCDQVAAAPVGALLTLNTVKAAALSASGKGVAATCLSACAAVLAEDTMRRMLWTKGKLMVMVLALGLAIGGASWAGYSTLAETSPSPPTAQALAVRDPASPPAKKNSQSQVPAAGEDKSMILAGVVVDEKGNGIANAEVEFKTWKKETRMVSQARAVSTSDGKFQLKIAEPPEITLRVLARSPDGERVTSLYVGEPEAKAAWPSPRLVLKPASRIELVVTDSKGRPVAGARTGVIDQHGWIVAQALADDQGRARLRVPSDSMISSVYALRQGAGFDYRSFRTARDDGAPSGKSPAVLNTTIGLRVEQARTLRLTVQDAGGNPLSGVLLSPWSLTKPGETIPIGLAGAAEEFGATTDATGIAVWDWLPEWHKSRLTIWANRKDHTQRRFMWDPRGKDEKATLVLDRLELLRGKVTHPDGAPAAGITIKAIGAGYESDLWRAETKTGGDGTYAIRVASNMIYLVVVADKKWAAVPQTGFAVLPQTPTPDKNFVLRPLTTIRGRVTLGPDQRPSPEHYMSLHQQGTNLLALPGIKLFNPENSRKSVEPYMTQSTRTDQDGRYEFHVGPGQYALSGPPQVQAVRFAVTDQVQLEFNFNAAPEATGLLKGLVVTGTPPRPVSGAVIYGFYRGPPVQGRQVRARTDAQGRFEARRVQEPLMLRADSADGKLAGFIEIGPEAAAVTLPLLPLALARGRLLYGATGVPIPDRQIFYGIRVPDDDGKNKATGLTFGGKTKTDRQGRFELNKLVAGQKYSVHFYAEDGARIRAELSLVANPGETKDLGDVKLGPAKQ
jgi:RNA polymerase sigma factor (sigma-70 family)